MWTANQLWVFSCLYLNFELRCSCRFTFLLSVSILKLILSLLLLLVLLSVARPRLGGQGWFSRRIFIVDYKSLLLIRFIGIVSIFGSKWNFFLHLFLVLIVIGKRKFTLILSHFLVVAHQIIIIRDLIFIVTLVFLFLKICYYLVFSCLGLCWWLKYGDFLDLRACDACLNLFIWEIICGCLLSILVYAHNLVKLSAIVALERLRSLWRRLTFAFLKVSTAFNTALIALALALAQNFQFLFVTWTQFVVKFLNGLTFFKFIVICFWFRSIWLQILSYAHLGCHVTSLMRLVKIGHHLTSLI